MAQSFKKFKEGQSGAYSSEYHQLLGKASWIVVRRLLRSTPQPEQFMAFSAGSADSIIRQQQQSLAQGGGELSEGDVATVFSQFGEVADVLFVRHRKSGRFLGTAFVKFKDYRSSILAADEMNSNIEKGELVYLTEFRNEGESALRGIAVERCEDSEVPTIYNDTVELYPEWLQRREMVDHC